MDEFMLNIVVPTNKGNGSAPKVSKTEAKKLKYANKMKMRKAIKSKDEDGLTPNKIVTSANKFNMGLMPLPQ